MAFLFYNLLHNPDTYHKAQQEVDEVLGTDALTVDHLPKLKYIDACIKETLRFCGPIAMITRHSKEKTIIGGKHGRYEVEPEMLITLNLKTIHHDHEAFGKDADDFKPERMLHLENIPNGAWRPFGVGIRSCIGRAFAEQEMIINVALILQRFQVQMVDPAYKLEYQVTLTLKPKDFKIKVRRRPGRSVHVGLQTDVNGHKNEEKHYEDSGSGKPLLVLYGSNAGTCQAYAQELAARATEQGWQAEAKTMDSVVEHLPTDRPIAIITPSYEGKPADNAKKFVSWLETNKDSDLLKDVSYCVFGVGNSQWVQTYHKVPKLVDHLMEGMGAKRLLDIEFVDVQGDAMGPFEDWAENVKKALGGPSDTKLTSGLKATISKATTAQTLAGFDDTTGSVKKNAVIADNSVGPMKRHMEIELPEGMTYQAGDYVAILPSNHRDVTRRVLTHFKLNPDDRVTVTETRKEFLKSDAPFAVHDLLSSRVELSTPATQRQLRSLAEVTKDPKGKADLLDMADKNWDETIKKRFSVLDVLEDHPSCDIDFVGYLDMLMPMTARQYSISSSMLDKQIGSRATATITYDVHETEAWSGQGRTFHGVASSHLADLKPGHDVRCTVRSTNTSFHLPKDFTTPIIMVCSGTGLAPMRGFIQERAAIQKARDVKLGPALLYFGCRDIEKDYIYKDELQEWEKQGVVSLRPCFSKNGGDNAFKYTSDRIWAEREECHELFNNGGKVFICGSASKIARSTADTFKKIWLEFNPGKTMEDAEKRLDEVKVDRYVSDVFG